MGEPLQDVLALGSGPFVSVGRGLSQLQRLYETILDRPLDKRNFRRKVLAMGFLEETDEIEQDVAHRAARLYRFSETKYRKLVKQGSLFEI